MRGAKNPSWIARLTVEQRLAEAQTKTAAVLDGLIAVVHLHANNQLIQYTDVLSRQIPRSFAGNAYRLFTGELMRAELMRLCALWDSPSADRNSLPTIVSLLDDDVLQLIQTQAIGLRKSNRQLSADHDDPQLMSWVEDMSDRFAQEDARDAVAAAREGMQLVHEACSSDALSSIRDYRDIYLAHLLDPRAKRRPDLPAKYGDETKLLKVTRKALDLLNLGVRGSSYLWDDTDIYAERNAKALWEGVTIKVLE